MRKVTLLYALGGIFLFSLSAGITYFLSSRTSTVSPKPMPSTNTTATPTRKPKIDPSLPRTEACPLNGVMYTKTEQAIWSTRRPLAVMIENHLDSRPTSGLSSADIVYEAVAEGGITRHMGVFYCGITSENTMFAPVRSARIYFVKLVPEYDALYNHVGGAGNCDDPTVNAQAKALCFIKLNKIKDLDQFGRAGDFKTCHRVTNRLDHEVAYEHTMACYSDELYKVAAKYSWTNVDEKKVAWDKNFIAWKFKDDTTASPATATDISFSFSNTQLSGDYAVNWQYDASTNVYKRFIAGQPAMDLTTNEQLTAKNVVVEMTRESGPLDEHLHMYYEVVGTGKMLLFQDGHVTSGTWSKASVTARTKFFDESKKEIQFNRGQIWIELLSDRRDIVYK